MNRIATVWSRLRAAALSREVEFRLCVRVTVAALAAYALSELFAVPQVLWTVLTAVLLTQLNVGRSLNAAIDYFIGTLGGAAYSASVAALAPEANQFAVFTVLAVTVAPLALLAAINPSFRVAPFTAVMVLLAPSITHVGPFESAFFRVLEVALGGMTALAVSFLVLPARAYGLTIEAAARMLDLAAKALPDLLAGFTTKMDLGAIHAIQSGLGQAIVEANTVADEAKREQMTHFTAEPDLGPLLRALLRLRHDLIMIGRGALTPLPEALRQRLAPPLAQIGETAAAHLRVSGGALAARRAPPSLEAVEMALADYRAAVTALRREGLTRDFSVDAVEHIFALGFALEQMHQDLWDLEQWLNEFARSPKRGQNRAL